MAMKPPPAPVAGQPDDLWERISKRPRPFKIVDYPVNGDDGKPLGKIAIRVLQQHEIELAAANAGQRARRALSRVVADKRSEDVNGSAVANVIDHQAFQELYDNIRATEILAAACRDAKDDTKPAFPSADEIRRVLTADEVGVLMSHYATVQSELGPIVAFMAKGDYEAWISRLTASGEHYPLDLLTREAHQRLTLISVQEVQSLRLEVARLTALLTDKSSPGSPLDSGTSSKSSEPIGGDEPSDE